jgi:hypothetical protein
MCTALFPYAQLSRFAALCFSFPTSGAICSLFQAQYLLRSNLASAVLLISVCSAIFSRNQLGHNNAVETLQYRRGIAAESLQSRGRIGVDSQRKKVCSVLLLTLECAAVTFKRNLRCAVL